MYFGTFRMKCKKCIFNFTKTCRTCEKYAENPKNLFHQITIINTVGDKKNAAPYSHKLGSGGETSRSPSCGKIFLLGFFDEKGTSMVIMLRLVSALFQRFSDIFGYFNKITSFSMPCFAMDQSLSSEN